MRKRITKGIMVLGMLGLGIIKVYAEPLKLVYDGETHFYDLPPINLYIDNTLIETYAMPPVQLEQTTLVPIREVFGPMGAFIEWKEEEKKVYINYRDTLLILEMDNPEIWLNGKTEMLDVPAKTINNKIMVPVRFISEQIGFEVSWDGIVRDIHINSLNEKAPEIEEETYESEEEKHGDLIEMNVKYDDRESRLLISLNEQIRRDKITVKNDYINKKIVIDLGEKYKEIFNETNRLIKDSIIDSIEIKNDLNTQIILYMKEIYETELNFKKENLEIDFIRPKDKYDKIVFLDAGHGGKAPGSIANELIEKEVNLKQVLAVKEFIESNTEIKVYLTREEDIDVSVEERPFIANEIGADLFVSIHNNSADKIEANGTEVLYYPDTIGNTNEEIAKIFQERLVKYCGLKDRGAKSSPDLWVLKMSSMPAVLIEGGFLSNPKDAFYLGDEDFTIKYAYAVYEAIVEIFNKM